MKKLLTLIFIALSSTVFAHGDKRHGKPAAAVVKEQKDWGIAGDYQAGMVGKITVNAKKAEVPKAKSNSGFSLFSAAHAQTADKPTSGAANADLTLAEVRRIDPATKRITLKHEPIKNLGMPAMTMVFQVASGLDITQLKVGDAIKFSADQVADKYTVTRIEK